MTFQFSAIRWIASFVVLFSGCTFAAAPATGPSAHRVLIISIDGCRPDLLLRADTPILHHLITEGAFTFWAQTTAVSVTIPSHTSMLTGARPQIHQIEWNHDLKFASPVYPAVPTLFEVAKKAGYSTAMVAGKSKFDVLNKPGTIDTLWLTDKDVTTDDDVEQHALEVIRNAAPQVLFVHLPENDRVGHAVGWGSPQQMETLHHADGIIGDILGQVRKQGLLDSTLVIINADHGGAGRQHGPDDVRSRCIPWIAVGPNVRRGLDLTTYYPARTIHIEDTFATACDFLNIPVDPQLDGKAVVEIYDRTGQELMLAPAKPFKNPPASQPAK